MTRASISVLIVSSSNRIVTTPRPGSMRHLELPSVAGGQRYYPRRPWAATDK